MLTHIIGAKCIGIDAVKVTVEVNIERGLGLYLVGLADAAVKESLLRTTTAIESLGYSIPGKKIVNNLSVYQQFKLLYINHLIITYYEQEERLD